MATNAPQEHRAERPWPFSKKEGLSDGGRPCRLRAQEVPSFVVGMVALLAAWAFGSDRFVPLLFEPRAAARTAEEPEADVVDLDAVKDGWTDPGALTFTHDGTAHLPKRGLRVRPTRTRDAVLEVVEVANGGHRAILSEPHQFRTIFPLEFGDREQTPWDPQGTVRDDEPVELALPSCADYRDENSLIPAGPCTAGISASVPYIGPTLPRYAMTLQIIAMPDGSSGWTSPDAFAIAPSGCLVLDLFRPLEKQPAPAATVKITALGEGGGWRADGPVPAEIDLLAPVKGWRHFYDNVLAAKGGYQHCPPYTY